MVRTHTRMHKHVHISTYTHTHTLPNFMEFLHNSKSLAYSYNICLRKFKFQLLGVILCAHLTHKIVFFSFKFRKFNIFLLYYSAGLYMRSRSCIQFFEKPGPGPRRDLRLKFLTNRAQPEIQDLIF